MKNVVDVGVTCAVACLLGLFLGGVVDTVWEMSHTWGLPGHSLRTAHGWSEIRDEHPVVLRSPVYGYFVVVTKDASYSTNAALDADVAQELTLLASN